MTLIISLLSRYVMQWLLVLLALSGLLMVFDLLANADNVLKFHPGEVMPLWHYTVLRVQQIISFVLPLAVLIAAMAVLTRMVLSQEMVILHSVGIPVFYVLGVLGCATAVIAFLHLAFANTILPHSSATHKPRRVMVSRRWLLCQNAWAIGLFQSCVYAVAYSPWGLLFSRKNR